MIELPEAITLGKQSDLLLKGKIVADVQPPTQTHKFTFFNGAPQEYARLLIGKKVETAVGAGIYVDLRFSDDCYLTISDGINVRYCRSESNIPEKYQLLITFEDNTFLHFNTVMYGCVYAFVGELDNMYRTKSFESISPLSEDFDETYFESLIKQESKNISAKALLATKQRIPGIGNGVLQDILFKAKIHPKRKTSTLSDNEKNNLFHALKTTLQEMIELGGRNTETDLLGVKGRYQTLLTAQTLSLPCPECGGRISKEAYLGGSVYYCNNCQKL